MWTFMYLKYALSSLLMSFKVWFPPLLMFYASGIALSLKNLLADKDITVRQKSTECLFVIAGIFAHQEISL